MGHSDTTANPTNIGRRDAMKKAAVAGAVVAWGAPVVQSLGSGAAFAQTRGSGCTGCFPEFELANVGSLPDRVRAVVRPVVTGSLPECSSGCATVNLTPVYLWQVVISDNINVVPINGTTLASASPIWARLDAGSDSSASLSLTVTITCGGVPVSCTATGDFFWPGAGALPGQPPASETNSCAGSFC